MEKLRSLIEFLKKLHHEGFYGSTLIKWENGTPVICSRIVENVKL